MQVGEAYLNFVIKLGKHDIVNYDEFAVYWASSGLLRYKRLEQDITSKFSKYTGIEVENSKEMAKETYNFFQDVLDRWQRNRDLTIDYSYDNYDPYEIAEGMVEIVWGNLSSDARRRMGNVTRVPYPTPSQLIMVVIVGISALAGVLSDNRSRRRRENRTGNSDNVLQWSSDYRDIDQIQAVYDAWIVIQQYGGDVPEQIQPIADWVNDNAHILVSGGGGPGGGGYWI